MGKAETIVGWLYFLVQQFIPIPMVLVLAVFGIQLSALWLNVAYFIFNFIVIMAVYHNYLGQCLRILGRNVGRTLGYCLLGFIFYWASNFMVSMLITIGFPDFFNANDANLQTMSQDGYWPLFFCTVFLVPITEEVLFRGVIFGSLDRVNRLLAYIVSVLLFSSIHVVGYIGTDGFTLTQALISLLQYLPASFALAWVYTETETIFAPALIHAVINLIGMTSMR